MDGNITKTHGGQQSAKVSTPFFFFLQSRFFFFHIEDCAETHAWARVLVKNLLTAQGTS